MIIPLLAALVMKPSVPFAKRSAEVFQVSQPSPSLVVTVTNGSVSIVEGRDGQIAVKTLTRADSVDKLEETKVVTKIGPDGGTCEVRDDFKSSGKPNPNYPGAVDYSPPFNEITLTVPPNSNLKIASSNASVRIGRITGRITVSSINGSIRYLAPTSTAISASSRNGTLSTAVPINLSKQPAVTLTSTNGDVTIDAAPPILWLRGARFWTGDSFKGGDWYVVNGRFTKLKPAAPIRELNMRGQFVSPAYGDAHCHHIDGDYVAQKMNTDYLAQGTLYVQSMGNHASSRRESDQVVNQPESIDVSFANAGFTSTWGHPAFLYENLANPLDQKLTPQERSDAIKRRPRTQLGDSYWLVESAEDLDRIWPRYLASDPDLAKIFLVNTKHRRENIDGLAGSIGLAPEMAALVVKKAHASGLRVYAHIDTAEDLYIAQRSQVDGLAHMPGYGLAGESPDDFVVSPKLLPPMNGLIVQPTAGLTAKYATPAQTAEARKVQTKNIAALKSAGARFALGSDVFFETQKAEALAWPQLGFKPKAIFQSLVTTTPQSIFPLRAIGQIAEGYEANFVVLPLDPLKSLPTAFSPLRVYKQGTLIRTAPSQPLKKGP